MTGLAGFRARNGVSFPAIAICMALLFFGPTVLFKYIWIDLRSVTVSEDLQVEADRVIWNDFIGSFSVTLSRASDHRFICSGGPEPETFPYRAAASVRNPLNFDLWEWASLDENWEVRTCLARGLSAGAAIYITTCHKAFGPFGVMLGRRCVNSNVFTPSRAAIQAARAAHQS